MGVGGRKIKTPAIFIDRDGTIIHQVELLSKPSQLRVFRGAFNAIKIFNDLNYLTVIITNQPVVARGIVGTKDIDRIHNVLVRRLAKGGAKIDAIYFCPHHPKADMKKYRVICECRKPGVGMITDAAKKFNIDLERSFLIGDSTQDVLAGNRAQIKMILVKTGHGGKDPWQHEGKPDFIVKNLVDAAKIIKKISKQND